MMDGEYRDYQRRAADDVLVAWRGGARSVCLVAPTGAGKTRTAELLLRGDARTVWVVHRRELVGQTADVLRSRFGFRGVTQMMGGVAPDPGAPILVATVQSLLNAKAPDDVSSIVLDEAHHYVADDWRAMMSMCPKALVVGLTATPQRADGAPLGDIFDHLVVAVRHSVLLRDGILVPACVYRPKMALGSDIAEDPVTAWLRLSGGARTFAFCSRVEQARALAHRFREAGIGASDIVESTPVRDRERRMARFRRGELRVLANVGTLTEGVDVPDASCALLVRNYRHEGLYLQSVGRVLRSAAGKTAAIILDLAGVSHRLGLPDEDRDYSLTGRAIGGGDGKVPAVGDRADPSCDVLDKPLEHVGFRLDVEPLVAAATSGDARRARAPGFGSRLLEE